MGLIKTIPLLLILTGSLVSTQISPQQHLEIRARLSAHDLVAAAQLLLLLQKQQPGVFVRNNYDYLLAHTQERLGNPGEARAEFQKVVARGSIFAGYATWHLAEIARSSGDFAEEQRQLQDLVKRFPENPNIEAARIRLGTSSYRSGKYSLAIAALQPLSGLSGSRARESTARIGEAQIAMGQEGAARSTLEPLVSGSKDDAALRAVTGLDRLDFQARAKLSEAEHLRRARIYQFNRAFAEARRHWEEIGRVEPASANRAEACFEIGRGYQWEEKFREAIPWFQKAYAADPKSDEGEQGFYYVGHCYQYLDQAGPAIARYSEFITVYPQSKFFGYAFLNAIDTLRAVGRHAEALAWAKRAQTECRDPFIQMTGLFQQARIHISSGNFAAALVDLSALRGKNLALRGLVSGPNSAEVGFLVGYCYEQLGRYDDAINIYLGFSEGRNGASGYYGQRATARLQDLMLNQRAARRLSNRLEGFISQAREGMSKGEPQAAKVAASQALRLVTDGTTRRELLGILRTAYSKLPAYSKVPVYSMTPAGRTLPMTSQDVPASQRDHRTMATELLFLGLDDEAAPELGAAGLVTDSYSLAIYYKRGDIASKGLTLAEQLVSGLPDDYRPELMPREIAELLYPWPYRDALREYAVPRSVDPRFLLSIARQESRFDSRVKSFAAARGLLQFISSTSQSIASQLRLADFEQDDLYHPETAILIGSQYMKNLSDEFGSPQAVAASYNGSEQSVRRWIARSGSNDVDRFVIEVGKAQTKDYVYKVMNNYWAYQALYPR